MFAYNSVVDNMQPLFIKKIVLNRMTYQLKTRLNKKAAFFLLSFDSFILTFIWQKIIHCISKWWRGMQTTDQFWTHPSKKAAFFPFFIWQNYFDIDLTKKIIKCISKCFHIHNCCWHYVASAHKKIVENRMKNKIFCQIIFWTWYQEEKLISPKKKINY